MITRTLIVNELKRIEKKEKVKILLAVESGSRGWGFESQDSDYDVRFIYVCSPEWYLSLELGRDVIEYPLHNQLDISGWDVKKALKLFKKSNPPLYEWLNSPLVYLEKGNFTKKLKRLMPLFYSPIACMHHYLSMAKGNYRDYLKDEKVKIKKYFYVLRPILACMWIEKYQTIPPMEFEKLLIVLKLNKNLIDEIKKLLCRKRLGEELGLENKIMEINNFLEEKIKHFGNYSYKIQDIKSVESDLLDKLFRETTLDKPMFIAYNCPK